jgi:hypothetical protein
MAMLLGASAVLIVLLLSGMIQQERIRLWRRHQEIQTEKRLADLDKHKQDATDRVRKMLRERREQIEAADATRSHEPPPQADASPSELPEADVPGPVAPLSPN